NNYSFNTRDSIQNFVNDFHNSINKRLGKKIYTIDESKKKTNEFWNNNAFSKYFVIIIIVIVVFLFFYNINGSQISSLTRFDL
ncbi:MAG: hypothetical protein KDH96_10890, partial [Candidatus Riesia sp.]|nr:hypothetical protein [Candidatus Riesia sp.]